MNETSLLTVLEENPLPLLLIFWLSVVGVVVGLVGVLTAVKSRTPSVAIVALVLGILVVGLGFAGRALARRVVESAESSPGLSARDRGRLRKFGEDEAWIILRSSFAGAAPSLLLGVVGLVFGRGQRR